ncbi:TPA: XRE family transcriptional regulator, partial [Streptococcus pyogenes]
IPFSLLNELANYYNIDVNNIFLGKKFVLKQIFKNNRLQN